MMKITIFFLLAISALNITTLCMDPYNVKQINTRQYNRKLNAQKIKKHHYSAKQKQSTQTPPTTAEQTKNKK